jgi:hypothetical protein
MQEESEGPMSEDKDYAIRDVPMNKCWRAAYVELFGWYAMKLSRLAIEVRLGSRLICIS